MKQGFRVRTAVGLAVLLAFGATLVPVSAAAPVNERENERVYALATWGAACCAPTQKESQAALVVNELVVDRTQVESLQRWVAAGHEEWCKDARLVAAKQVERIAPEFGGDATELQLEEISDGQARTFAWAGPEGTIYRVTVERFDWLLPIAGDADGIVWVPTAIEIEIVPSGANDVKEVGGEPILRA